MTKRFKREQKPQRPRLFSNEVGGGGAGGMGDQKKISSQAFAIAGIFLIFQKNWLAG